MTLQSWSHLLQGTKTSNSKCIEINWIINIRLSITIRYRVTVYIIEKRVDV